MLTVGGVFDGIGLLAFGLHLAGLEHRWLCEVDPWRRSILEQRFPGVPVIEDVRAVGSLRCERVDVIAGGFPCKGASTVGLRNGFGHPETVLWREMFRAVRELEPRFVVVENVANLLAVHDGAVWGEVVGDLASLGFDIEWDCLPAAAVGAPHLRDRVFAVAAHPARIGAGESTDAAHAVAGSRIARPVVAGGGCEPAADSYGAAVREQPEPERRSGRATLARGRGAAPTNAGRGGRQGVAAEHSDQSAQPVSDHERPGLRVEWGRYAAAIKRWEQAIGRVAPEPLVSRMGDRRTGGVDRSRVSAVGDGVQVQIGELVGAYVMDLAFASEAAA